MPSGPCHDHRPAPHHRGSRARPGPPPPHSNRDPRRLASPRAAPPAGASKPRPRAITAITHTAPHHPYPMLGLVMAPQGASTLDATSQFAGKNYEQSPKVAAKRANNPLTLDGKPPYPPRTDPPQPPTRLNPPSAARCLESHHSGHHRVLRGVVASRDSSSGTDPGHLPPRRSGTDPTTPTATGPPTPACPDTPGDESGPIHPAVAVPPNELLFSATKTRNVVAPMRTVTTTGQWWPGRTVALGASVARRRRVHRVVDVALAGLVPTVSARGSNADL